MKIWIVSEGEPLPIDGENVRLRRMGQLCKLIANRGHEVHWFTSNFHHYKKEIRNSVTQDIYINNNYFIHLLEGKPYKKNVSIRRIIHHNKIAKEFLKRAQKLDEPDLILATMAPLELSESIMNFSKGNINTIIDIRDLWPEIYEEVVPASLKKLIKPYIFFSKNKLKKTLNQATALIAVTDRFLEYGLEITDREKSVKDRVFHTSYKIQNYTNSNFENDWGHVLSEKDFIISFIGNFGKQFITDDIITVAKDLTSYNNIKFVLCGGGANYNKLLKETEGYNNIVIKDWIEGNQIDSLLKKSDIGIAPYRNSINFKSNIPNKFGEYLSYGLPILVSVPGEMEKQLSEFNSGYYYKNSDELKKLILKIYNNLELKQNLSNNSTKLYEAKFNADVVYNKMVDYFEDFS